MNRCYNCGLHGHGTKVCPTYGPYWPEPGKSRDDYAELTAKIQGLLAEDIIKEHEGVVDDDEEVVPVDRDS